MANNHQQSTPPELGDLVKDRLTPFKGIVVSKTFNLAGSTICGVQANGLVDGKPEPQTFEEGRLWVVKRRAFTDESES
jgi:hypothetical protein